ncbi:MAG: hypothetical protein Q9227_004683 [Pyrenula ochraceoflavens]
MKTFTLSSTAALLAFFSSTTLALSPPHPRRSAQPSNTPETPLERAEDGVQFAKAVVAAMELCDQYGTLWSFEKTSVDWQCELAKGKVQSVPAGPFKTQFSYFVAPTSTVTTWDDMTLTVPMGKPTETTVQADGKPRDLYLCDCPHAPATTQRPVASASAGANARRLN